MKKIWLFLSLIMFWFLLIWCSSKLPEYEFPSRGCGIYNDKYPERWGSNDWTDLTVAVRSWTDIGYIKKIIWKKYICYEWTNSLKGRKDNLPDDAIWYRFSLKIYPNPNDEEEQKKNWKNSTKSIKWW